MSSSTKVRCSCHGCIYGFQSEVVMCSAPKARVAKGKVVDYQDSMNQSLSPKKRAEFAKKANAAYEKRHPNEDLKVTSKEQKKSRKTKSIVHKIEVILVIVVFVAIAIRVLFLSE
ncbi:hypothetical protein L1077_08960 [Pseudoalteromonas luteoviolacea]|nr:hypothetical protein [Pseudoalteromonas luteoviolacea]